jgi:hypothetical protein
MAIASNESGGWTKTYTDPWCAPPSPAGLP